MIEAQIYNKMYVLIRGCTCCSIPCNLELTYQRYCILSSNLQLEEASADDPRAFLTNLPSNFLDFSIVSEVIMQLYKLTLCHSVRKRDIATLFERLCVLLAQDHQNLIMRSDCIAPEWIKKSPLVFSQIYSKLWHPSIVEHLIYVRRFDLVEFVILKGASIPKAWENWLLQTFPSLAWVITKPTHKMSKVTQVCY